MRKITPIYRLFMAMLLIWFIVAASQAQHIGFNGQGWLENRTEQSDIWIEELVGNEVFTIRFPGGAATKYVDPISGGGWGINYTIVDSITAMYGSDEEEATADAVTKWRRKADAQPDYSYLDDIVQMQQDYPNMRVIWSANYLIPADRAFYPIEYLVSNGVNVVCVEMGNESYSQMDYNFSAYWERTRTLATMVKALLIDISYPIPATGLRGSKSHSDWISELNAVIDGGVTAHPYYDGREFPALKSPIDTTLAFEQIGTWDFNAQFQDIKSEIPNAQFYIVTESNTQPAALIGDTELNAYFIERLLTVGRQEFRDFTIHNGVAPDKYGVIYGTPQKRNTSYYAFQSVLSNDNSEVCDTIITPATYDTTYQTVEIKPTDRACSKWYSFLLRKCKSTFLTVPVITLLSPADTVINCEPDPIGCVNTFGSSPNDAPCKSGSNDDYVNMNRFVDASGNCICDECGVIFDHRINTKFNNTIIPNIYEQTGVWINTDLVDFYITLPETGETVVFEDVFNWCRDGKPYPFNTNQEVFNRWTDFLTGVNVHTFNVEMIDRETGINIAFYWMEHLTMTLYFTGLW